MLKSLCLLAVGIGIVLANGNRAQAQVAVTIGEPPVCPYGYYEVPPYNCAPDGYYGPEWFSGGVFIGAGPWFHGPDHFYGTLIITWTIARAIMGQRPHEVNVPRNTEQNFTARQCMTRTAKRRHADVDDFIAVRSAA
jgi:hypothetical protein